MYPRKPQSSLSVKPKKSVSFYHTAFVVLIPTVKEYHDAGLANLLWWNDDEFHGFKVSTASEVREYVSAASPTMSRSDAKLAMKLYFQQFINEEDALNSNYNKSYFGGDEQMINEQQNHQDQFLPSPIISERSDSITGRLSAFAHQEQANQLYSCGGLRPNADVAQHSTNTAPLSTYDPKDNEDGGSSLAASAIARVMALGLLVFMNRS
jgi:hypothetical protein